MKLKNKIRLFIKGIELFLRLKNLRRIFESFISFVKKPLLPIILYKMLIRSFIYWYSIAQGLFVVIYLIFDFFVKIDKYISNSVSVINILIISFLLVPKAIWTTMPIAIMFGIIMSIALFYQDNELIAIFTSGISIYKFVIPLIALCFFLSIFMIFFDSYVSIPTFRYRENLFEHVTKDKDKADNITIKGEDDYFWTIEDFDSAQNMLKKVLVFKLNREYKIVYRLDAFSAVYTKDGWVFSNGTLREWDNKGDLVMDQKIYRKLIEELKEKPKTFRNIFNKSDYEIEKMTIMEARERIKLLKGLNIFHNEELRDYYKKFSFPFTLLVVCLIAIGVSTLSQKNIIILALFFSIGLAILYYIAQMIFDILSATGKLFPFLGAWLPIFIFIPLSLYLVTKAKT